MPETLQQNASVDCNARVVIIEDNTPDEEGRVPSPHATPANWPTMDAWDGERRNNDHHYCI